MAKRRRRHTIQWPKEEEDTRYNGQKKKKTHDTMAKRRRRHTIQWPKENEQMTNNDAQQTFYKKSKTEKHEIYCRYMTHKQTIMCAC